MANWIIQLSNPNPPPHPKVTTEMANLIREVLVTNPNLGARLALVKFVHFNTDLGLRKSVDLVDDFLSTIHNHKKG